MVGDVEQELLIDDGAVAPLKTSFALRWNFGQESQVEMTGITE